MVKALSMLINQYRMINMDKKSEKLYKIVQKIAKDVLMLINQYTMAKAMLMLKNKYRGPRIK
jgi:hypothetical protein